MKRRHHTFSGLFTSEEIALATRLGGTVDDGSITFPRWQAAVDFAFVCYGRRPIRWADPLRSLMETWQ